MTVQGVLNSGRLTRSPNIETVGLADVDHLLSVFRYTGTDDAEVVLEFTPRCMAIDEGAPAGYHLTSAYQPLAHGFSSRSERHQILWAEG